MSMSTSQHPPGATIRTKSIGGRADETKIHGATINTPIYLFYSMANQVFNTEAVKYMAALSALLRTWHSSGSPHISQEWGMDSILPSPGAGAAVSGGQQCNIGAAGAGGMSNIFLSPVPLCTRLCFSDKTGKYSSHPYQQQLFPFLSLLSSFSCASTHLHDDIGLTTRNT